VTQDLELLRTDDEVLGRSAAAVILATDAAIAGALYALRCEEGYTRQSARPLEGERGLARRAVSARPSSRR